MGVKKDIAKVRATLKPLLAANAKWNSSTVDKAMGGIDEILKNYQGFNAKVSKNLLKIVNKYLNGIVATAKDGNARGAATMCNTAVNELMWLRKDLLKP